MERSSTIKCQSTFKDLCQYPKCDCDRPKELPPAKWSTTAEDIKTLKMYLTNPVHGGKVTCHKCGGFIEEGSGEVGYRDHQHSRDFPNIWFHLDCYDPDVDYWSHVMN